ncbi:MAG: extracellular solute-binding protein [Deltaproteobacteria bacterium]|nr:extracellular solute-binding protein [Deltaproteobacteria bacterium]
MFVFRRFSGWVFVIVTAACLQLVAASAGRTQTIDDLYKKAKEEGGKFVYYGVLAQINAAKLLPIFEKRFPGIKVDHVDATSDKLVARAVSEARGGKTLGDVFSTPLENVVQMGEQGLLLEKLPPEAAVFSDRLKGSYWIGTEYQFIIAAWNTTLVKKDEEPKQLEDFAHPRWKNRLIAEPRDVELLIALARDKYNDDKKALDMLKRIAANNIEFHKGHSQLVELLVAGQAAACLTCYSHHFPPRIKKGAPVNYMLSEGIGTIVGTAAFKNAPHPNTAWLWMRWAHSEEGQKAYAVSGRTPAHPKVEPVEKTRPAKIYPVGVAEIKDFAKYEKLWKEVFRLR